MKVIVLGFAAGLLTTASVAKAFELDSVLPDDIPGYESQSGVVDIQRLRRTDDASGVSIGGLNISPSLTAGTGFDSAPNGAAPASILFAQAPSVKILDTQIGLGVFAGGMFQQYPGNAIQSLSGSAFAAGEQMILPRETVTLAASYISADQTGFSLTSVALNRPQAFAVLDTRAKDEITLGYLTVTPDISLSRFWFAGVASQNRADLREDTLISLNSGGPSQFIGKLDATQSRYQTTAQDSSTWAALAGVQDSATAIWTIRLLVGVARRLPASGKSLTAPVTEAAVDWMPDDLDRISLHLSREIDDPTEISATPDTLSQIKLSLSHEYLRNLIMNFSIEVARAAYLKSTEREMLTQIKPGFDWRLSAAFTFNFSYGFNGRQANFLPAANENIVTGSLIWTP